MSAERPSDAEQPHGGFAAGESHPDEFPEDDDVGRFSEGQEELPEDPHRGRFSEGQEELPEDDPEKHASRRFSEGQDSLPPGEVP